MQHHGAAPARVAGEVVGAVVLAAVTFLVAFYAVAAAGIVSTWLGMVAGVAVAAVGVYELARGDTKRRVFGGAASLAAIFGIFLVVALESGRAAIA
jgi:hypothetical protein